MISISELLDLVRRDYRQQRRRSADTLETRIKHLERLLPEVPRTGEAIERYKSARLAEGGSPSSINSELSALSMGLKLARYEGRIDSIVVPRRLSVTNARQGFLSPPEFERLFVVLSTLDANVADLVAWLWETGWRVGEARDLTWDRADVEQRSVYLARTKTGKARRITLAGKSAEILERRWKLRFGDYVFSRRLGRPITHFEGCWHRAVKAIGRPELLVHDLRRSFARRATLAGIPAQVTMSISGWDSSSSFRRYSIVDEGQMASALERLSASG